MSDLCVLERTCDQYTGCVLDLDHYKRFNDTYGHQAREDLLRDVGRVLQAHVRGKDIPCRYGGEEFLLLMPGACTAVASTRAEAICVAIGAVQVGANGLSYLL